MTGFLPPLVQEAPRTGWLTIALYWLSSIAGGGILGALLGAAGVTAGAVTSVARGGTAWLGGFALLAAAIAAREAGLLRFRLPEWQRQVPVAWRYNLGPVRAGMSYGASLGTGLATFVSFPAFYALLAGAFLAGPAGGGLLMGLYGAAQALPVLLAGAARARGRAAPLSARNLSPLWLHRACAGATLLVALAALHQV